MNHVFQETEPLSNPITYWHVQSKHKNLPYHILVSVPKVEPPIAGFPVIYVLDGNAFFYTVKEQVRLQSTRPDRTKIPPSIVVGIGYPNDQDFEHKRRFYDFTFLTKENLPPHPKGMDWPETGGAEYFLSFIENELKTFISQKYPVDQNQQSIFGHSLGGLLALEILYSRPNCFQTYLASSPSIWWNDRNILKRNSSFSAFLPSLNSKIGLFLSVGALERDHMIHDAKVLYDQLTSITHPYFKVGFYNAGEENHLSVVPTILSRALRFIEQKHK
ncbi:alpha/beta hydrolase [Hazenella sp. IB182357]|uniref:Alpha/beta hydrolase n=1 Tax=Polycladospora coralii TaxID=2771432 RepID=A0A926RW17_9BACL|nr:alpha/beta hydrolase-fold protein [Polycladospora coralii]MBD1371011.1 alpha/beta hydrolase [Polycladospora coralii]MBS7529951.1 alpha/beta hydrolase [Polycladospora coralii]